MATTRETVRQLLKTIITRLENQKAIAMQAEDRQRVIEELDQMLSGTILTEEDLRSKALETMGLRSDDLVDASITESEQYRVAKKMVRKSFGDDELHGLFFQQSLKSIAGQIASYLMSSDKIEDVFEDDSTLEQTMVDAVKRFNPANLH